VRKQNNNDDENIILKFIFPRALLSIYRDESETMAKNICVIKNEDLYHFFSFSDLKINITLRSIHFPLITQANFYNNYFIWKKINLALLVNMMRSTAQLKALKLKSL
jgi:hypothetical protein